MNSLDLALVEDDPEVRALLSGYLGRQPELNMVLVRESAEQFLAGLPNALPPPAVVLLDLGLPGLSGLEALPLIKQRLPHADVIVQTVFEGPDRIFLALSRGASGYLLRNTPLAQLPQAIREVASGGSSLSPLVARRVLAHFKPGSAQHPAGLSAREQQVLEALMDGLALGRKGWDLSVVGLLPLAMGAFDWYLLSPLRGVPFEGPNFARCWAQSRPKRDGLMTVCRCGAEQLSLDAGVFAAVAQPPGHAQRHEQRPDPDVEVVPKKQNQREAGNNQGQRRAQVGQHDALVCQVGALNGQPVV